MIAPLYILLRRRFDRRVTTGCILLIIFSPLVWELGTYFHPIIPATLLLLLSLLTWEKIAWSPSGCFFCLLTYILASASVVMRAEVLLVTPALCAGVLLSRTRRRNFVRFCSVLPAVLITYLVIVQSISKPTDIPSHGLLQFVQTFGEGFRHSFSFAATRRSIIWACLGIGTGLVFVSAFGLIARPRNYLLKIGAEPDRDIKDSIVAIIWIAPILIL